MENVFSGYFGVVLLNMTVPIALFLEESSAKEWAHSQHEHEATVRKYPASSLSIEALNPDCRNL